jgi:amidohydrolase
MKEDIHGTIKFIFQPAEEGAPIDEEGGAALMIKEGVLENPHPEAIFGLHVLPNIEVGQIAYNSGATMASSDRFEILIHGKKVHGAYPHEGIDAILVAAESIEALQHIHSRRINTQEPFVLTIGKIQGGDRHNIIAQDVKLEGTLRTLNEEVRTQVKKMMNQTLTGITSSYGAHYSLNFSTSNPVTYNAPNLVNETLPFIEHIIGKQNVVSLKPQMGAEDFSQYQQKIPGFFYFLGVGNSKKGITAFIHTAEFDLDEESLVIGTKVMSNLLFNYLEQHANQHNH